MTTYTPGPWTVSTNGNVIAKTDSLGGHVFIASTAHPDRPTEDDPMRVANAALIAAAPLLLAALQAVEWGGEVDPGVFHHEGPGCPACGRPKEWGPEHEYGCGLAAALKAAGGGS